VSSLKCSNCGSTNRSDARHCRVCSALIAENLAVDGVVVGDVEERYCDHCGQSLVQPRSSSILPDARLAASIGAPAPIEAQAGLIRAERKHVTVLFADISGSTEIIVGRDPEEARLKLDSVIEVMIEAVHLFGGTVNQILGDGIKALFGAPIALEDHAVRACLAATRMQGNLSRAGNPGEDQGGDTISIRVGIASGEVVMRSLATDFHLDYTAMGETTHLAARLEQIAEPGTILCSAATARLSDPKVVCRSLGRRSIRGLGEGIEIFQVVGTEQPERQAVTQASLAESRFVGRLAEREIIEACLRAARGCEACAVAVVGEPGIGKSRLTREFIGSIEAGTFRVLASGSISYGKDIPYHPIIPLLTGFFGLQRSDEEAEIRGKIAGGLRDVGLSPDFFLPGLLSLLGVTTVDPAWTSLDPTVRRQRIGESFHSLLFAASARQPLLLVIEDLHWIDRESLELLDALIARLADQPLMVLLNHRADFAHAWPETATVREVALGPLPSTEAEQLLGSILGPDPSLTAIKATLVERAEGNAFFLEESIKALVESGALLGSTGAYRMEKPVEEISVPASVHSLLAQRIDNLSYEAKTVIQPAAVIGGTVAFELLLELLPRYDETELTSILERVAGAGLMRRIDGSSGAEWWFSHSLIQEVAYRTLLREQRRALHERILTCMEELYAGRPSEHIERLAYHARLGENWVKAAKYLHRAGQRAAHRSAYQEATVFFEQAIEVLDKLEQTRETLERAIDIRFDLRNAFYPLGEIGRDLEHLRAAERLAKALGDARRGAWVSAYIARDLALLGKPDESLSFGKKARDIAREVDDAKLAVLSDAYVGSTLYTLGDYRGSVKMLRRALSRLGPELAEDRFGLPARGSMFFRTWLIWSLARLGEFKSGFHEALLLIEESRSSSQPLSLAVAHLSAGFVSTHQENSDFAIPLLERSLKLCEDWQLTAWFTNVASALGISYARAGRHEEGLDLLHRAVERSRTLGIMVSHSMEMAWLGEAYLLSGRVEEAEAAVLAALELAREFREWGNKAEILKLMGDLDVAQAPVRVSAAESNYRQALELAEACGMRPLIARCRLALGRVYEIGEDAERAADELRLAQGEIHDIGMYASHITPPASELLN